jgi:hypothetical protein
MPYEEVKESKEGSKGMVVAEGGGGVKRDGGVHGDRQISPFTSHSSEGGVVVVNGGWCWVMKGGDG